MKKKRFRAETILDQLTEKSISWLNDNYHKFSQTNKIKISLEIIKKKLAIPLEGIIPETKIIIIRDGNKTETVSRQVHILEGQIPSNGIELGNREVNVRNLAGNDILRANT